MFISAYRPPPLPPVPSSARVASTAAAPPGLGFKSKTTNDRGAYFRKVETGPSTAYRGITGYLPEVAFDPKRYYVSPNGMDHYQTGPLDRPSVYMGGNANGHEADVGLSWDRVYDSRGRATYTDMAEGSDMRNPEHRFVMEKRGNLSVLVDGNGKEVATGAAAEARLKQLKPNFAFRPYWRTNNNGKNEWNNPKPGSAENVYFYPGEKFTMSVSDAGKGQIRLDIKGEDGISNVRFSKPIAAQGFGEGGAESFKRVNSIDQFYADSTGRHSVEKRNVIPTRTHTWNGGWESVTLLGRNGSRVPMAGSSFTEIRGADTAKKYDDIFKLWGFDNKKGGERVDIVPFSN